MVAGIVVNGIVVYNSQFMNDRSTDFISCQFFAQLQQMCLLAGENLDIYPMGKLHWKFEIYATYCM